MSERTACIVGAGGGIGAAVTRELAAQGYDLICLDLPAAAASVAHETGARAIDIDLARPETIEPAFIAARRLISRLDALVCVSGIVDNGKLADLSLARWNEVLAINVTGIFLCCQSAREWLVDGGRIVTLGSLAGRTGGVITGAAYAASKGAVESLTKSMAQELAGRRITVNCVAPGAVETPMVLAHSPERRAAMAAATPLKRFALPEEIAATVAFLLSEGAAYITGAVIPVNGGLRMD
jgi:3-oxoacyl-[acyl-carrier protein] reductase